MSGLGAVLDIAKNSLLTQQSAINIVGHNIANVSTDGYTRQAPVFEAKNAVPYGGLLFGQGVKLQDIIQIGNNFIEGRLRSGKSDLAAMSEKQIYANILESIFNESSGSSLSNQFVTFWAAWNDLANNPSGLPERNLLYENSVLLCQSFNNLYSDLDKLSHETNNSIQAGVNSINQLTAQIARLNEQILVAEVNGTANDLRDQRNNSISQLSELIDIRTYESSGTLTVTTGGGSILVSRVEAYPLSFAYSEDTGTSEVFWENSAGGQVKISDTISGGKIGGWLEVRDELIPKIMSDLNELARATILEVNKIHTQGVGLERFTALESSYSVVDSGMSLAESSLSFAEAIIADGGHGFRIWLYNNETHEAVGQEITVGEENSLLDLAAMIGAIDNLTADIVNGKLTISTTSDEYSFAFSDDTSFVLAALGINNFFVGDGARSMAVKADLNANKRLIAAGKIDSNGNLATGDNTNALGIANLEYESVTIKRWTYARGQTPTSVDINHILLEDYLHSLIGEVGIKSQSIYRETEYKSIQLAKLSELRDNISAVSLDEEMTNLIKFQQAYMAAAKLITAADEMFQTILATR